MLKNYRVRDYNFKLVIYVLTLTIIGIMAIGSADESLQSRQLYGFLTALFLMVVISLFDYSLLISFHWVLYIVNVILLLLYFLLVKL